MGCLSGSMWTCTALLTFIAWNVSDSECLNAHEVQTARVAIWQIYPHGSQGPEISQRWHLIHFYVVMYGYFLSFKYIRKCVSKMFLWRLKAICEWWIDECLKGHIRPLSHVVLFTVFEKKNCQVLSGLWVMLSNTLDPLTDRCLKRHLTQTYKMWKSWMCKTCFTIMIQLG